MNRNMMEHIKRIQQKLNDNPLLNKVIVKVRGTELLEFAKALDYNKYIMASGDGTYEFMKSYGLDKNEYIYLSLANHNRIRYRYDNYQGERLPVDIERYDATENIATVTEIV